MAGEPVRIRQKRGSKKGRKGDPTVGRMVDVEFAPLDPTHPVELVTPGLRAEPSPPIPNRERGQFTAENAREAGRRGGLAKKERASLFAGTSLSAQLSATELRPFLAIGRKWRKAQAQELAALNGGKLGPGPSAILSLAARNITISAYLEHKGAITGDDSLLEKACRISEGARQSVLAATALASQEGRARAAGSQGNAFDALGAVLVQSDSKEPGKP